MSEIQKKNVILVTGMSGAGKSSACRILEDMGYHIIDNYPASLIAHLEHLLQTTSDPRYNYIVLSTSANDFESFLHKLKGEAIQISVLFLDADDATILRRYKSTRRIHPLLLSNKCNTLEEAISLERSMFTKNMHTSFTIIDTSNLQEKEFRTKIQKYYAPSNLSTFSISFISFGYKYGVPLDADLLIDVRFLINPFWDKSLRTLSGDDEEVYNYVMSDRATKEFLERLVAFLDYSFIQYKKEGKNHLTVAIGCTGGQHRSVSVTNYLYANYANTYRCYKEHRDEAKWVRHYE